MAKIKLTRKQLMAAEAVFEQLCYDHLGDRPIDSPPPYGFDDWEIDQFTGVLDAIRSGLYR